jgi:hypothetical protein
MSSESSTINGRFVAVYSPSFKQLPPGRRQAERDSVPWGGFNDYIDKPFAFSPNDF